VIVGCFDTARAAHERLTAAACNDSAAAYFANVGAPAPVPVTDDALDRIRARLADLVWRWKALSPGQELELEFRTAG
jgi:hypothetical protein